MDQTIHFKRHRAIWRFIWRPTWLWTRLRYNYHPKTRPIDGPALIVSNHVTDLDPFLVALTVKNFAYFVASSHVFSNPKTAKLIEWAMAPIGIVKGTTAGDTALTIMRRLKKGYSVGVFAEGNRTFNGVTDEIVASTAKLARSSGASLVTHRFRGGYLTSPRWSGSSVRRGLFTGEVVNIYSPETLKSMTVSEIADAIRADIYENAYETQAVWNVPYKGKNLAEHLERALCLCPSCDTMGSLVSRGDEFFCTFCGLRAAYTPQGCLEGENVPFHTVLDWDHWQTRKLQKRALSADEIYLASDTDMELFEVAGDYTEAPAAHGRMALTRDHIEIDNVCMPLSDISGMSVIGPQALIFTCRGTSYTVRSRSVRNMRKYATLYQILKTDTFSA